MRSRRYLSFGLSLVTAAIFALRVPAAHADTVAIGYVSYDVTTPPGAAQFDINNLTGPNEAFFAPDFPVATSVSLSNLSLDVSFASGPDEVFGSSYFTLSADGLSFTGNPLSTGIGQPNGLAGAISATLTGTFDTTALTLYDASTLTIDPNFTATISDPSGLTDGDSAVIYATVAGATPPVVPEPTPFFLVGTGLLVLVGFRIRHGLLARALSLIQMSGSAGSMGILGLIAVVTLLVPKQSAAQIHFATWTNPSSGASGSTVVTLTGNGFPGGTVSPSSVTLSFSSTCGGTAAATESPNSVITIIGTVKRLSLLVPASLNTGTYYISAQDGADTSANCAEINVSHTSTTLAACLPSSSLAVLTGKNVDAYIPKGAWSNRGQTGISRVPIEGTDTPVAISTGSVVNSCSSNSATGETICVDNQANVFELTGPSIIKTLTSGADNSTSFTGGQCLNCGVAIDALTNTAVISGGFTGNSSGQGVQLLNLSTDTFSAPFPTAFDVSENPSVDPDRNLILSPGEDATYDLLKINSDGSLTEYANQYPPGYSNDFDSAAEDCTTGIALSTEEFYNTLFITDLTQAVYTPPTGGNTYGSWTAPSQAVPLNTVSLYSAGTSGISVAAGTTHLGLTTDEFGGANFVVFKLPDTSGSGTPNLVDYAGVTMPNTPDGYGFQWGYDPHTVTAYTSPNDGKAYGVVTDWAFGYPNWVGVIDLQALLDAPRTGSNTVDPTYDLVAHGVIRYIPVP